MGLGKGVLLRVRRWWRGRKLWACERVTVYYRPTQASVLTLTLLLYSSFRSRALIALRVFHLSLLYLLPRAPL